MRKIVLLLFILVSCCLMRVMAGPTDTLTVKVTFCDSITWHGTTYYEDTVATHLISHESGRDTLYVLDLHINYSSRTDYYDTACSSYLWMGTVYTASGDYAIHHQAANGCDSVEILHLVMRQVPDPVAISGDTLICRNQYAVLAYPVSDTLQFRYEWYCADSLVAVNKSRIGWFCPADGSPADSVELFRMVVSDLFTDCSVDTFCRVWVSPNVSPDRPDVVRKPNSNILVCSSQNADNVYFRWGMTNKTTVEEVVYDWNYNYFQYDSPINTDLYDYWVEAYKIYGDVFCHNRAYYDEGAVTSVSQYDSFSATAVAQGDQLLIRLENPSQQSVRAVLCDVSGRVVAQFTLGNAPSVRHIAPFRYASGVYLLTFYAGNQCLTLKIAK